MYQFFSVSSSSQNLTHLFQSSLHTSLQIDSADASWSICVTLIQPRNADSLYVWNELIVYLRAEQKQHGDSVKI